MGSARQEGTEHAGQSTHECILQIEDRSEALQGYTAVRHTDFATAILAGDQEQQHNSANHELGADRDHQDASIQYREPFKSEFCVRYAASGINVDEL